jgi:adenine/guanine/hypoxanthine permease
MANENTASWWALDRGDIDATIAQLGFNIAQLIIPAVLLVPVGIPLAFSVGHLLPGYALGFFIGSLGLTSLAVGLRRRTGRADVTAHPYGSNVPAMIAYTLAIMLPVYLQTHDQVLAWQVGAAAVVWTGIFKLIAAPFSGAFRRWIPVPASMTVFAAAMYSYLGLVLLQRIFDSPLVGIVALVIVCATVLPRLPVTKYRLPPFLFVWLIPMLIGLGIHYIHPVWTGVKLSAPLAYAPGLLNAMKVVLPYLSVILPMSIYQILQDIAAAEGAATVGDNYDAKGLVLADAVGTLICGLAGSVVCPIVYAILPPYKVLGARISYVFWTGVIFLLVVVSGITSFATQLFPWSILSAMIAYITVGVGHATFHRVDRKYLSAVLLGLILPTGAVITGAVGSALPALRLSLANPDVLGALNRTIFWNSLQGLGNGFLFLVLVVAALITEMIDRNFTRAAFWCALAAAFSWVGLMHSPVVKWGAQPMYAIGWLCGAVIVFSAHFWRGNLAQPVPASASHEPAKEVAAPHR